MAYERKTRDEYRIMTDYGYGYECECTAETMKEAQALYRDYVENATGLLGIEIVKRRVRKEEDE